MTTNAENVIIDKKDFDILIEKIDGITNLLNSRSLNNISEEYLTMEETRKYLQVSDVTIYRYIREAAMPTIKFGNARRFKKSEIDAWINQQKINR